MHVLLGGSWGRSKSSTGIIGAIMWLVGAMSLLTKAPDTPVFKPVYKPYVRVPTW